MQVGRQAKAGCNPFTIQLADEKFLGITKLKAEDFSGKHPKYVYMTQQCTDVTSKPPSTFCIIPLFEAMCQLAGLLGGMTLEDAMRKGTLFYQDYYTVLGSEIVPKAGHLQPHVKNFLRHGTRLKGLPE